MSATNRGAARKANDFYETPFETSRVMSQWLWDQGLRIDTVLDPAAGAGALLRGFAQHVVSCDGRIAFDIRPECEEQLRHKARQIWIGDALGEHPAVEVDLVVCNPPYSLAREFVTTYRYVGRTSAFLLRLGFLASQSRAPWWVEDPPAHVLVLPARPSFTGNGKTDAADYCWCLWRGKTPRGYTRMDWLAP